MMEYLEFFEDVGMEPIMAVWSGEYLPPLEFPLKFRFARAHTRRPLPSNVSGYSLGGTSEPEDNLAGFIQQAKDQVGAKFCHIQLPTPRMVICLTLSTD